MPQINRIRVNNVKYNFGTQFYDDFIMRFSGKNTIYDLANGGGKSVLMLLLLQNIIPNCTLDDKQPIEKLFRTGNGSNTIHSLIEWNLSDVHIKENYKYMLTGFCARKAGEEEKSQGNTANIDYFNYVIFYREYNDNDIKNLPLSVKGNNGEQERITYQGLKNYLRELEKKDFSLEIKIFDKKGDYQRFIANYGIYESEWEIIRGINKTEGHVRTYFESNYKTTRKVVEDLFIEEIIEKAFKNRILNTDHAEKIENHMAETLLEIKDRLLTLAARKEDISNYDNQMELLHEFADKLQSMNELYEGREKLEKELSCGYHALKKTLERQENKKHFLEKESEELFYKKVQEEKYCEIIKIQKHEESAEKLKSDLAILEKQEEGLQAEQDRYKKELIYAESMNDYLDYLYYKKERDIIRESISRMSEDKKELLEEMAELAAEKKQRNEERFVALEEEINRESLRVETEKEKEQYLEEEQKQQLSELAVWNYKISENEEKLKVYNKKIADLKNEAEYVMLYHPEEELKQCKKEKERAGNYYQKNKEKQKEVEDREKTLKEQFLAEEKKLEEIKEKLQIEMDKKSVLSGYEKRVNVLKEIYEKNTLEELNQFLSRQITQLEQELVEQEKEQQNLKKYEERLQQGRPAEISGQVQLVLDYLERYHQGDAVLGEIILQDMSMEEREKVLRRIPILPYSVIIRKNYAMIAADHGLRQLNMGNYAVPLLDGEIIFDEDYNISEEIIYATSNQELFYDKKAVEREMIKIQNQRYLLEQQLERQSENKKECEKDYKFVRGYAEYYENQLEETEKEIDIFERQISQIQKNMHQIEDESEAKQLEKETLLVQAVKLQEEWEEWGKRCEILEKIIYFAGEADICKKEEMLACVRKKEIQQQIDNQLGRLEAWKTKINADMKHLNHLKTIADKRKSEWEQYRNYYKEGVNHQKYKDLSEEDIEARFLGALQVVQSGNSDIADKQKLQDNYETAMEKSLQAIDYKGIAVAEIKQRYENGVGEETSKEKLLEKKKQIEKKEEQLKSQKKEIRRLRSEKDRVEGAIIHGKEEITQKYGTYDKVELKQLTADEFLEEHKKMIEAVNEKIKENSLCQKEMQEEGKSYEILVHDMERWIPAEVLEAVAETVAVAEETLCIQMECVMEEYQKFRTNLQQKKELYEKEKNRLAEQLKNVKGIALADEINKNLVMPSGTDEVTEQRKALEDTVLCLKLEKERIEKNIQEMEKIKKNFESQCIQSCINIKTELEKLPKLSKIVMDQEVIPIISLEVPYIKEELYSEKMSEYINQTVEQADEIKTEMERVKFIRGRLAWKRLFSVIVRDMNEIKIKLYKRERMKEQSRYLRYEEAVGSTGQSQGIYIQFLIALINYISSINSKDADSVTLKKVIFIDNPFGAAKDIYIWEPIFEMLKTNNVQLIVPCRGATPAITGRFDVNYVLGQKLVRGRQQTVVVDYYSNVNTAELDYTVMSYEQTSLENFL